MVKILQAYNFSKQHTYSLSGEILAATIINSNRIAISSTEQFIEIYDVSGNARSREDFIPATKNGTAAAHETHHPKLNADEIANDEKSPAKYSLATVGEVVNLIYCEAGKYLLTLEKENLGSPIHSNSPSMTSCTSNSNTTAAVYSEDDTKMFVRIYANFTKFHESKLIDLPITIRIASMTTPKAPLVESIDVIELPLRSPPNLIQCCQTSGNIIVSSKDRIYLYEYTRCTHENTQPRFSYIDFLPFKFFVSLNFIPLQMKLAENVIACMNNRYCVAFKVVDVLSNSGVGVGVGQMANGTTGGTCGPVGFASVLLEDNYDCNDDDEMINVDGGGGGEAISSNETSVMSKASFGGGGGPSSHNSFETDSLETASTGRNGMTLGWAGFPGRNPIDFNVARMVNSVGGREFEVDLKSQWEQCGGIGSDAATTTTTATAANDSQDVLITPMRASDIKIKLVNEAKAMNVQRISNIGYVNSTPANEVQYDIRKLLQICMKTNETNGRIVDILRCIDLKAIYQRFPTENFGSVNAGNAGGNCYEDNMNATHNDSCSEVYEMGNQQVPSAVSTTKHTVRRTLKSNQHQNCIGYALLVASSVDGYLYQFCAQGKWYNENEKPIATYSFTAPIIQVHINDYVIYAITSDSVETHTSRIGNKLFNNRFEYPSISNLYPEESNPDMNAPITVVGLCSFMHVQYVCLNRDQLVMISNSALAASAEALSNKRRSGGGGCGGNSSGANGSGGGAGGAGGGGTTEVKRNIAARLIAEAKAKHNLLLRNGSNAANHTQNAPNTEWTLYSLQIPKVEHIVEDIEAIAETYRAASSTNFHDLMEEAHIMLRLSLTLQCEKFDSDGIGMGREQLLRTKFLENCNKLANFCIRSTKKDIYVQATGFYKMCNLQISDIYTSYIETMTFMQSCPPRATESDAFESTAYRTSSSSSSSITKCKSPLDNAPNAAAAADELIGFIYTVKNFLLAIGTDRMKAAPLNQLVKPFFTPSRIIEQGYPLVPLILEFLNMFIKYSPSDIPQIMLNSPVLADAISGDLINYLKYLEKLTPDENLLLAVTACRMSNYIVSQETISKTNRRDLGISLIEHKNVLFDDGTVLCRRHTQQEHHQRDNNQQSSTSTSNGNSAMRPMRQFNGNSRRCCQAASAKSKSMIVSQQSSSSSFSDFTETILLATENPALIEAISDAFIHALCIECICSLDMILQLFLNYIATHIGHKGYQTSQKVFVNILQVYYYDLFDVNPLSHSQENPSQTPLLNENDSIDEVVSKGESSSNSERENDSANDESNSCTSISIEDNIPQPQPLAMATTNSSSGGYRRKILYDILQEQQSPFKGYQVNTNTSPTSRLDESSSTTLQLQLQNNETNLKGLKILFRMYLGRLKALSDLIVDLQSADVEQQQQAPNVDLENLRMECVKFMTTFLQELRENVGNNNSRYYYAATNSSNSRHSHHQQQQHDSSIEGDGSGSGAGKRIVFVPFIPDYKLSGEKFERYISEYIRPMPCLLERPQYLNRLPPFRRSDFSYPNRDEGETEVRFVGWHNEVLTLTLKIQSLLSYSKIDREIIEEFIAFIQKSSNLIGVDSFLVIVLPKNLAINYMLGFCPEYLWHYGKSNGFTPKHWESLIRKIVDKPEILPNWKAHLTEILNHLVAELTFEELMQCFPNEVLLNRNTEEIFREFIDNRLTYENDKIVYRSKSTKSSSGGGGNVIMNGQWNGEPSEIPRDHLPLDNIDENNVFELTLRKAVSKQRSIALRSMIESTGTQLFDATSNPMYNL